MAAETNVASHCEYFLKVLPVSNMSTNITGIKSLLVEYSELSAELKNKLEFPLHVIEDPEVKNRKFIACELNRVGASYRSPWSNKFYPPLDGHVDLDTNMPSEKLRVMEQEANELFTSYKDLYYMGGLQGVSSAYFKDTTTGFNACFLIKKMVEDNAYVSAGAWESINAVHAVFNETRTEATYTLTTTVMLTMAVNKVNVGETNISGMLTKRAESSSQVDAQKTPMSVIGRMIEDLESDIRLNLNDMYILKTKEIVDSMRIYGDRAEMPSQTHMHTLNSAILGLGLKKDGAIPGSENT